MKVTGSASVAAPVPKVWEALRDPAVLARTIPGCRTLESTGPDAYAMTVAAGVASIKGTYSGRVELTDPEPPRSFVLRARGQGAPGTVEATVRITLSEQAPGTRVDYDADAVVGGMIGGVGQRMLGSVARRTAGEFFTAVDRALSGADVVPMPGHSAVPEDAGPAHPAEAPAVRAAPDVARPRETLAAFAAGGAVGGAVALAGVLVGYALGRRGRKRA